MITALCVLGCLRGVVGLNYAPTAATHVKVFGQTIAGVLWLALSVCSCLKLYGVI